MNNQIIKFLSLLKNSSLAKKKFVTVNYNNLIIKCIEALYKEGLILSYSVVKEKDNNDKKIQIKLRNVDDIILTSKIKIVSKPTNIKYLQYHQLCRITLKEKTGFFSTNKGILTLDECKKNRLGGVFSFYS
jgi:ribosomal protein S8